MRVFLVNNSKERFLLRDPIFKKPPFRINYIDEDNEDLDKVEKHIDTIEDDKLIQALKAILEDNMIGIIWNYLKET